MNNENKIIILGHEIPDVDSIVSGYLLEKILKNKGINCEFVIPDTKFDDSTIVLCKKYNIDISKYQRKLTKDDKKFILVDHNERNVNGEIIGIIDHHPTSKAKNIGHYYNKLVSSTACFICQGNEEVLSNDDLKLCILATMVDTASFHSVKGRKEDKEWIDKICQERNIEIEEIYKDGLCLTSLENLDKAYLNGLKKHNILGKNIHSSIIQIENKKEEKILITEMLEKVKKYLKDNNLYMFAFIVHDMTSFKSKMYKVYENRIEERQYDEYTSRGSKVLPDLEEEIRKQKR